MSIQKRISSATDSADSMSNAADRIPGAAPAARSAHHAVWKRRIVMLVLSIELVFGGLLVFFGASSTAAPTSAVALSVISARDEPRAFGGADRATPCATSPIPGKGACKGDAIAEFKYVINIDDTGTTDQRSPAPGSGCSTSDVNYPDSCHWQSIAEPSGWSPIYTQGDQQDFAQPMNLPDGRYLISVIADGYKIDGAHFCVETGAPVAGCADPLNGQLVVELQPNPVPDGTLRAQVFEDNAPTNMGQDTGEANLAGFVGHIVDSLGEIQTDVYGNPLCTRYEGEKYDDDPSTVDTYEIPLSALDPDTMLPIPKAGTGGECVSDANGMLAIPHLGSNRYAVSATPPDGQTWIQTTTLEGNHDYDAWVMEGDTGFDQTFTRGGEVVPLPIFGFVKPLHDGQPLSGAGGHIKGTVVGVKTYTPPTGGAFDFWGGNTGTKVGGPIVKPWLSLMDLDAGDLAIWVGRGDAQGKFDIAGVPNGNYTLAWWDEPQDYNLNFINVTVANGEIVQMGQLPLNGWWTEYSGYVFDDANRNGKMDWNDTNGNGCPDAGEGELGVPNFSLTLRHRENNLYDRGQNTATTDACGHYYFESGYPIGEWIVMEAYSDVHYTTGVTYQADNQPTPTTVKGAGVDISVLPIIGLSGTVDWGVHKYATNGGTSGVDPDNGGIVGTVSYGTTRNELDPQYFAAEDWQPGVSGVPVELHAPVACGTHAGGAAVAAMLHTGGAASAAVAATLSTGSGSSSLTWTAGTSGAAGNQITVELVADGADAAGVPTVAVTGNAVVVHFVPGLTTANQVLAAVNAASPIVTVSTGDGTGFVAVAAQAHLAGGTDAVAAGAGALTWTAGTSGAAGNQITVELVADGADAAGVPTVAVTGNAVVVHFVPGLTTANQVLAAVNAASPIVTVSTGDGTGFVAVAAQAHLAGGADAAGGAPCDATDRYELAPDGSYALGKLLNTYVTESWERPTGCTARDVDGKPLVHGVDENVLVRTQETNGECISSFMQEIQFSPYATDQGTPDANFGAAVNGNYGFGDGCFLDDGVTPGAFDPDTGNCKTGTLQSLPTADYLVHVVIPKDEKGKPLYKVTGEEDINIANGDQVIPQVAPPACAGALHTVDIVGFEDDGYPQLVGEGGIADLDGDGYVNDLPLGVTVAPSTPVDNATFVDIGGSPFEGQQRPRCDTKLVDLADGKSIAPLFEVFTDVPVPARLRTVIIDDLKFSNDPRSIMYGEKQGLAFAPVGIYDFANKLEYTTETDFNGIYDVLMPSTNHISCPTPSGVCANMYRVVANDPGIPGRLNPNYDPGHVTHAAGAEAIPGVSTFADLAPTPVGIVVESPATGLQQKVACTLDEATPQLFAVSRPYVHIGGTLAARSFTISGWGFGSKGANGKVTLDGTTPLVTNGTWNNTTIEVTVPDDVTPGPYQLNITGNNGQSTVNGLTLHVLAASTRADNANTFNGRLVFDPLINAGDVGATVTGTGIPAGTTIVSVSTAGPILQHYFVMSNAATQTGYRTLTITKAHQVSVANGGFLLHTATDTSINSGDVGRTVSFSPTANGLTGSALILSVTAGSSFTWFAVSNPVRNGGLAGRTATITASHPLSFINNGTFVLDSAAAAGDVGAAVTGPGIPAGSSIASLTSIVGVGTGFTMNNAATATSYPGTVQIAVAVSGGGSGYNPNLYEVGPGKPFAKIQAALDAAHTSPGNDLVVVYPGEPDYVNPRNNPRGAYYENLIVASPVKLQGVGPGGFQGNTFVPGSIIDASAFGTDTTAAADWYTKVGGMTWSGNQNVNDGEAIYVLASRDQTTGSTAARQFTSSYKAAIDGFDIRGATQDGFPGNINDLTGAPTGLPPTIVTQGGAIFANAYARYLQITNNVVQNNGSGYGTIRLGTPELPPLDPTDPVNTDPDNQNENIRIARNRIISNGSTNLAGGIGLYNGSDNYEVAHNDICGNFSLEYGGGLSVYGRSPNGKIHHNRIYFNMSNDEGGGIMVAGQLPQTAGQLSSGSGAADIYANQIQANLANDDGGGIRFLMAGNFPINVYDNMIVNNVSTHEGGGIGIDDAPNVRIFNNTIMKNLTTATAVTSNGDPAPAGLSTSANSDQLQATLPSGSPLFSNPLLFNNVFWDNRAGTRAGTKVTGIGVAGDATPINLWDIGVANGTPTQLLAPTNSIVQQSAGTHPYTTNASNSSANPNVGSSYDVSVNFATWRRNPAFVDATLVTVEQPPNLLGNYHLAAGSPAINLGAASKAVPSYQQAPSVLNAPAFDFDDQVRPSGGAFDSGADEFGSVAAPPPPPPATASPFYFSTAGNTNPPDVAGTADDADIYSWDGTAFFRATDVTAITNPLPTGANVDGLVRVDATHFYLSFSGNVTIPVPGPDLSVADEDVVYYNAGSWSLFFDGSANGVAGTDLDAISIVGGTLYFSTDDNDVMPGTVGAGDDADIYRWNGGSSYTRMVDASAVGWSTSNVDGLVWVDATHVYVSYSSDTNVPGIGAVQDEDIVRNNGGTWSVYFDGTAAGLTSNNQDVDAFDVP